MTVRPPVQTSTQLGVSNTRMLWRGLITCCPACGGRRTHRRYATMLDSCPQCSLRFERIFGHSLGYIGLNTIVTFSATFLVLLVGAIITQPEIPVAPLLVASLATAGILPVLFLPATLLSGGAAPGDAEALHYGFAKFLLKNQARFQSLLRGLRAGDAFDDAFNKAFGGLPAELVAAWSAQVGSKRSD